MRLFHFSEEAGIARFDPRESPRCERPVVWAIGKRKLHLNLLPRDCPHVWNYWVSGDAVTPLNVSKIHNPSEALLERGAELRVVPNLWALHEAVIEAGCAFSMIRLRNAEPKAG